MKSKPIYSYIRKFEFGDRDHFAVAKGIAILAALIAWFCGTYLRVPNMSQITQSATALFVLCSAFGLSESYLKKRGLFHYWENKVVKVWFPSLIVLILVSLIKGQHALYWIQDYYVALKGNLMYVVFAGYIVFWVAFKFIPNRIARILTLFGASVIALIFVPESFSAKAHIFCLPVGVLISQMGWKRKIRIFGAKGKTLLFVSCLAMAAAGWFAMKWVTAPYLSTLVSGAFYMAAAAAVLVFVWLLQKLPGLGIFGPVGTASYMLYLLYDSVFELLKPNADWRVFVLVVVILFAAAGVLTWLRELLVRWNKNLRRKGKTQLKGSM